MAEALLVFASTHGQTAKIAARIAEGLRAEGVADVNVRGAADAAASTLPRMRR